MSAPRHSGAQRITALAEGVAGLRGWRRSTLAFLLGVLATLSLPPVYAFPVLFVSFAGLLWLIAGSNSPWRALIGGWWFGFGFFLASIYWIGAALLTDAERFGWLVVPAVLGLGAGFALFPAGAAFLVRASNARGFGRVAAFAAAWTAAEWLRGHILTGFPMNLIGTSLAFSDATIQLSALTGAYGLSFAVLVITCLPACMAEPAEAPAARGIRRWLPVASAVVLLAALWLGGSLRLNAIGPIDTTGITLRVVQANIAQDMKWRDDVREAAFLKNLRLSVGEGFQNVDHVILSETAVPYFLSEDRLRIELVAGAAPPDGLVLTGAPRRERAAAEGKWLRNSVHAIDARAQLLATYDKHHLVPFGEYMPLRDLLSFGKLAHGAIDYTEGPGPRTLHLPGLPPLSPLVCFEAIFPGNVIDPNDKPDWLLNLTNDGWFGHTAGPYQHLQAARLRAVEEGLPMVRAANTGISAFIDPVGRVIASLPLGATGVLDAELPKPLAGRTIYTSTGDWLLLAGLILSCFAAAWRRFQPK